MNEVVVKKRNPKVYIPLIAITLFVLGGGFYWYWQYSKYISTDDAHVDSDNVSVGPKILGRIAHLYVDEGDSVKSGMLVAELDSCDLLAQLAQSKAMVEQQKAALAQAQAKYEADKKGIKVQEVNLDRAKDDYNRAKTQFAGDVIPKEQFEHAKKTMESAQASLESSNAMVNVSKAQVESSSSAIASANAQVNVIETQLKNTKLYAPFDGIVAKRWLLAGDVCQPGQSVFTITNKNKLWVAVYIEETKLSDIRLNQDVVFSLDAFSGIKFRGKVYSIGSNTASQFSLIPQNNASGNFTKVTQRVPLKISIDGTVDNRKPSDFQILSGMSAVVKIIRN
jgi:membrane fusion protein (multidrug efflux system)